MWFDLGILPNMSIAFHNFDKGSNSETEPISAEAVQKLFSDCDDFRIRPVRVGLTAGFQVFICWLDGVVSEGDVSEDILRPLTEQGRLSGVQSGREALRLVQQGAVWRAAIRTRTSLEDLVSDLTSGHAAVIFEAIQTAATFEVKSTQARQVSEAAIEKSVKGPRAAFVETLRVNTALVRRRLRTPKLKLKETTVGRQSGTLVTLLYIEGIADPDRVQTLQKKLDAMDLDGVLSSGDLEPYLIDHPRSPFPQMVHTERPDKLAAGLLEGRIGLLCDGLPVGFLLPGTLPLLMQAPEDRADHHLLASGQTLLRWAALILALILPALYTAVATWHQEMLPAKSSSRYSALLLRRSSSSRTGHWYSLPFLTDSSLGSVIWPYHFRPTVCWATVSQFCIHPIMMRLPSGDTTVCAA